MIKWLFIVTHALAQPPVPGVEDHGPGNGGGGFDHKSSWVYLIEIEDISIKKELEPFFKENPNQVVQCSGKSKYIETPKVYQNKFIFKKRNGKKLTHLDLCTRFRLRDAYNQFLVELHRSTLPVELEGKKYSSVGKKLIDTSYHLNQKPIEVIFHVRPKKIEIINSQKNKEVKIKERSWFDHHSGMIHWSRQKPLKSIDRLVSRNHQSFFRHELAHVLVYRALGKQYPHKITHWHDFTDSNDINVSETSIFDLKTSEEAAFVEGFAFAMEAGTWIDHPYLELNFKILNDSDGCYAIQAKDFPDGRPPLQSEGYLGSVLTEIQYTETLKYEKYDYPKIQIVPDIQVTHQLIEAMSSGSKNIIELLQKFDAISERNMGLGFLREYFWEDYRKGHSISSFRNTNNLFCIDIDSQNGPLAIHKRKARKSLLMKERALFIFPKLEEDIKRRSKNFEEDINKIENKFGNFNRYVQIIENHKKENKQTEFPWEATQQIYDQLQDRFNFSTSFAQINSTYEHPKAVIKKIEGYHNSMKTFIVDFKKGSDTKVKKVEKAEKFSIRSYSSQIRNLLGLIYIAQIIESGF